MSVWVMPSVDVYENFLKQSQAVGTPTKKFFRLKNENQHKWDCCVRLVLVGLKLSHNMSRRVPGLWL